MWRKALGIITKPYKPIKKAKHSKPIVSCAFFQNHRKIYELHESFNNIIDMLFVAKATLISRKKFFALQVTPLNNKINGI